MSFIRNYFTLPSILATCHQFIIDQCYITKYSLKVSKFYYEKFPRAMEGFFSFFLIISVFCFFSPEQSQVLSLARVLLYHFDIVSHDASFMCQFSVKNVRCALPLLTVCPIFIFVFPIF